MFLKLCRNGGSESVFQAKYGRQLWAALSVNIIAMCHGIGLGWLSPMLVKLQSPAESPLNFYVTVEEASWIGALISAGGLTGTIMFAFLLDRFGRKPSIFLLAVPHMCLWILIYFAQSVEYLCIARICGGMTGGGVFIVVPIFIGEISDPKIRGRLTSIFSLGINIGILIGFILSSHISYHLIPFIAITFPLSYMLLAFRYPETPQYLLRRGHDALAEKSLKYYRNYAGVSKEQQQQFHEHFMELQSLVRKQTTENGNISIRDFLTKPAVRALSIGIIMMGLNIFSGTFALVNYMSNIFAETRTELHPDTNTIIIGAVQIVGTYTAIALVDSCGRKILMIWSSAGMGLGLAAFGLYAFLVEEDTFDLSAFSSWLPVVLVAIVIFLASVGINAVTFVIVVEIMPVKIRSKALSICLAVLCVFAFTMLKMFPILMSAFGLSTTMWFCATVCAFGLFYVSAFLQETKGKSMDKDDAQS